jgi:hypothetical protein
MLNRGEPGGPVNHDLARFSVIPRLYGGPKGRTSITLDPFAWKSGFRYDDAKAALRRAIVDDMIGALIIDCRAELAAAWREALKTMPADAAMKRLSAVPVTEEQTLAIAGGGLWDDAGFKNRALKEWSAYARLRYAAPEPWFRRLHALPAALALVLAIAAALVLRRRNRAR